MAGFLPNVPGVRIPYHRDGTLVKTVSTAGGGSWTPTAAWTTVSSSAVTEMNNGNTAPYLMVNAPFNTEMGQIVAMAFPQTVTLTGHNIMFAASQWPGIINLYWSADTTDGIDGTWTYEAANVDTNLTAGGYRSVSPVNLVNVKGIQFRVQANGGNSGGPIYIYDFALYGQWVPQTLAAWHPTLDQQITGYELDFGDVVLGNVYNKQFRIKNGRSLTANSVVVSCTTGTTELINGLQFSLDGTTFTSNVTVPSIAPGAISGTVYVRRTVSAGQSANILAIAPIDFIASSWT